MHAITLASTPAHEPEPACTQRPDQLDLLDLLECGLEGCRQIEAEIIDLESGLEAVDLEAGFVNISLTPELRSRSATCPSSLVMPEQWLRRRSSSEMVCKPPQSQLSPNAGGYVEGPPSPISPVGVMVHHFEDVEPRKLLQREPKENS